MTTMEWKTSLLLRSYAYGSAYSNAVAHSEAAVAPETADINAQLEALGFDAEMVHTDLQAMPEAERYSALQGLGVELPQHA